LVGSIVLPILGAVPDGMMTLFSGLGEDAQSEVGIGMGVLAGSTVMLLTFPWFIAVMAGRVPLVQVEDKSGKVWKADYKNKGKATTSGGGLFDSGVSFKSDIADNAKLMLGTTLIYLVIQIPASMAENKDSGDVQKEASAERLPALIGMILSVLGFFGYLFICFQQSQKDDGGNAQVLARVIEGIKAGEVSLSAALQFTAGDNAGTPQEPLIDENKSKELEQRVRPIVKPFFAKYDTDKSNTLEISEFKILLSDLGVVCDEAGVTKSFKKFDVNEPKGSLDLDETAKAMTSYMTDPDCRKKIAERVQEQKTKGAKSMAVYSQVTDDKQEEEEAEEMPEDLRDLSPEEQQARIMRRAVWMMSLGTFIVLLVSDPFVDVLNVWGTRLNIPPFYVSFVVAPFASNASELLSAYVYAAKKTQASITTSLSTLIGAACMNNTFVLAIFFALVYFKKLAWRFTAETVAIMVVQWIIGCLAIFKDVHSLMFGVLIFACYPLCLCIVAGLEAHGFD
jgi:Ca2+/Na+ antiporter